MKITKEAAQDALRRLLERVRNPSFLKKAAKRTGIGLAVIAVIGFLLLPLVIRPVLEKKLSEALHRTVTIRSLYINPFTIAAALKGVTISQRGAPDVMLSFEEFYVNVQAMSLVRGGLIVSSVRLVKPYVSVARNKDLSYSFSDLLVSEPAPPKEEKKQEPFKFSINNIEVVDGSADLYDAPKNTRHTVRDLNIAIPFLSNLPYDLASYVEPAFRATVNNTAIVLKGKTLPFNESLETTLDVDLKDIDLPYYLAYSPVPLNFRLLSGKLDVLAVVSFQQFKDRPAKVSLKGTAALRDIRLADRNSKRLIELSRFSVSFLPSDLLERTVHLSDVSLIAPKIYVERGRDGQLGIVTAFVPGAPAKASAGEAKGETEQEPAPAKPATAAAAELPIIDIDTLSIRDGLLLFTDWQPAPASEGTDDGGHGPAQVRIDKIALTAGALSTRKDVMGTIGLSLNINGKGGVRTEGKIGLNPLDLETSIDIGNVALAPFQPYAAQQADILLADGRVFAKGTARVSALGEGGISASYRGSASLARLDVRDARNNDALLGWKSLQIDGIDAKTAPFSLKVRSIALNDFLASVAVEEDGVLALQKVLKKSAADEGGAKEASTKETPPPASAPGSAETKYPPDISIGQVTLAGGTVIFSDRHVQPMYSANLLGIEGKVTGLSSKEDRTADVLLRASFDQYAPLTVTGKINPLRKDLFADVKAAFKDMELSPLTPYSGTYIGRTVQKGKLSFDLAYHVEDRKLEASNNVFIDQLTLGGNVDSPKATSLPVGLAISLLKNRNGEIKLDIPVSGSIDDPEFSIWGIVLQVLVNLLTKAATSPFALLGSLMGGEELGYVEFDYGLSAVTDQNAKKLDTLVIALYDRPALKLEIAGYADPANDVDGFKASRMKEMIVVQKVKDLSRQSDQAVSPDAVQVSATEYPVYLKKAYQAGKFSKPRNFIGIAKELPNAEMEKLLLASIQVTENDLRQLAIARARTVRDAILKSQKVGPERVFLIEPKSFAPEQKEKLRNSRVEFTLK